MILQQKINIVGLLLTIVVAITFSGCQEEYAIITETDKSATFEAGDSIAGLILRMTMKDGSFDDILDNCSEISINFPYSVQVRYEIITINAKDDIKQLEEMHGAFANAFIIQFPVTVSFSDHSEMILDNRGDLKKIQNQCNRDKKEDKIKCIDFIYPFDINLYNVQYQKPEFVSVKGDKDLHGLLKNRNDILFEIDFPVFVEIYGGTVLKAENNFDLEEKILNAIETCSDE